MKWSGLQFRHPRTAVGWNRDSILLVQADGRQNDLSVGMSFPELAQYMRKLGCDEAVNLDGGGSATCWVLGNVMNNPSEGRERPSPNALVVVEKKRATK
jgi:exopolysaccharide biosynthesis protein